MMARRIQSIPYERTPQSFCPPHILSEPLRRFFSGSSAEDLKRLCLLFPDHWDVHILGGVLRNLLIKEMRGIDLASCDVDIVVNGPKSPDELRTSLQHFIIRQNDFGGAKCRIRTKGLLFDVWRIGDHVSMSSGPGAHTVEQLLRHNLLDVDAVLWDLKTDWLHEYGSLAAIQNGRIELMEEGIAPDFATVQVAHILITTFKTGFELSELAQCFIREVCLSPQNKDGVIEVLQRKAPAASAKLKTLLNQLLDGGAHTWASLTV